MLPADPVFDVPVASPVVDYEAIQALVDGKSRVELNVWQPAS
jgi:hypothetical protein